MEDLQGLYSLDGKSLGKGTFGDVQLAIELKTDKKVAAKKIPQKILYDQKQINLINNEILISTTTLSNEKYLLKTLDLTEIEGEKYMICEYCNGGDLYNYLHKYKNKYNRFFDEKIVKFILTQVLQGLQSLHQNKITHHDIKPSNILLSFENDSDRDNFNILNKCTAKIADFGLSNYQDNGEKSIRGSPLYLDPNLFDKDVKLETIESNKVDIWSIGIMTYELLFGKTPFENISRNREEGMKELIDNLKSGMYILDLSKGQKYSKQFLCFLDCCLQTNQKIRKDCIELNFSEFISRDYKYFEFIDITNFKEKIPNEYISFDERGIMMNSNDEFKLCYFLGM
jgi:serine/threonine protein kinase